MMVKCVNISYTKGLERNKIYEVKATTRDGYIIEVNGELREFLKIRFEEVK